MSAASHIPFIDIYHATITVSPAVVLARLMNDVRFLAAVDSSLAHSDPPSLRHLRRELGSRLELLTIPQANWSWSRRWSQYTNAVGRMASSTFVVVLDTDVTFVRDPLLVFQRWHELNASVVIAGERGRRPWETKLDKNPGARAASSSCTPTPTQANAGFIAGRASDLVDFMRAVSASRPHFGRPHWDDQVTVQMYLHSTGSCGGRCVVDHLSRIVHTCACDQPQNFALRGAALSYVPDGGQPAPFAIEPVMLHGAGKSNERVCASLGREYQAALRRSPSHCAAGRAQLTAHALEVAKVRASERDAITLHSVHSEALSHKPFGSFWGASLLQPTIACPASLWKTTSAAIAWDGGKWMCGLRELREAVLSRRRGPQQSSCTMYSFGSNFDDKFERSVQRFMDGRCEVHIYDPTLQRGEPERLSNFTAALERDGIGKLHLLGLDAFKSTIRIGKWEFAASSLPSALAMNGHTCVDILKVDVEGSEHGVLEGTVWGVPHGVCVGMLLLELHGFHPGAATSAQHTGTQLTAGKVLTQVRRLEDAGLQLYSSELVCPRCNGQAELAFINVTWLSELC